MMRTVLLHFLREGMELPERPRALHKNRARANLHDRPYRQLYRRPGWRPLCCLGLVQC